MNKHPHHEAAELRTDITGWVCRNCRRFYGNDHGSERAARFCCTHQSKCSSVGCDQLSEPNRTLCRPHLDALEWGREKERFDKAEKIPFEQWPGAVYCEGFGAEFFEDSDEFITQWIVEHATVDDEDLERLTDRVPTYVYAADVEPMVDVDASTLYGQVSDNAFDEWDGRLNGRMGLESAIEDFNNANAHLKIYRPNYSKVILLDGVDAPPPVCEP